MNRVIAIAAATLAMSVSGALAQTASDAPPIKAPAEINADDTPPPPPPPGPHGPNDRLMANGPMEPKGPMGMHRHPPPPSKAAHFKISDGDVRIDIKCADDEPMKACADILMQVMDRVGGNGGSSADQ